MSLTQVVCVALLLTFPAPACCRGDSIMDILGTIKEKIFAVESSLETDIKLLRQDLNRLSNKFDDLPTLFKDGLHDNAGETPKSDKISGYTRKDYDQFTLRMKRAFTEEKVQTRRIMGELKSEIAGFGERLVQGLTRLEENQAESMRQRSKQFENFKKDTAAEQKQSQTSIQIGLIDFINESFVQEFGSQIQTSVVTMTTVTKQCVSGLESLALVNKQQTSVVNELMAAILLDISNMMEQLGDDVAYIKDKLRFENGIYSAFPARLANISLTSNTVGGRLEVLYDERWGTVCDDNFRMADAVVACKMMGFSGADSYTGHAFFGPGYGEIWIDEIACNGQETTLFRCSRLDAGSPGTHNCHHNEDVGVICKG